MSQAPAILHPVGVAAVPPFENGSPGEGFPPATEIRAQLRRIVGSKLFAKSDQLRRLLRYLVEAKLQEPESGLKETVLGMEVFGRGPDFDPRIDPIVRVEARRLRSRLSLYYHQEGCQDAIVIRVEPGGYSPQFQWREIELKERGPATFLPQKPVVQVSANDPCAAFVHEAMAALTQGTIQHGMLARQMFQQAVAQWPERPEPHAGLSLFFLLAGFNLIAAKSVLFAQAREAAQRALQLNPECALAHGVLGSLEIVVDYDFANANHHLLLAMRAEPGNGVLRNLRCNLWLMPLGFLSCAQEELSHCGDDSAVPASLGGQFGLAQVLYLQRRHKEAIAVVCRLLKKDISFAPAIALLAFAYHAAGEHELLAQLRGDPALIPYPLLRLWIGGSLALATDDRHKAREIVRQMEAEALPQLTEPVLVANLFARLEEHDRAFAWLEHAFEARALRLLYAETDPLFDQLRNHERFAALTTRMHLTQTA